MSESALFIHVKQRVATLEAKFLATQLADELANPLTFQPDVDLLAAFRLLVHAELEDYLERKAKTELLETERQVAAGTLRPTLQTYALANHFDWHLPHDCPFDQTAFEKAVTALIKKARNFLDDNNGIKSATFSAVCIICGKTIDEIDSALGERLRLYGKARGDVAHSSAARVTTIAAPSAEKTDALNILSAISVFFYPPTPPATVQPTLTAAVPAVALATAATPGPTGS